MKKLFSIFIMLGIMMISSTVLAFPKDISGYRDFYFGEDKSEILSKYKVNSIKNGDDGSVYYSIESETEEDIKRHDDMEIFAVPSMTLEFKNDKLCSITRYYAGISLGHALRTFQKLSNEIEKSFGTVTCVTGSKEDKIMYYAWSGEHAILILSVEMTPMDIPDPDVTLYRVFFMISDING